MPTQMVRENATKDIWITDSNDNFSHLFIKSNSSEIFLHKEAKKTICEERLTNLTCIIQEKVDKQNNSQQIRFLRAEKGLYTFPSNTLKATKTDIFLFSLHGTEIPKELNLKEAYLKGSAEEISLSLPKKTCEAKKLKGTFSSYKDEKYDFTAEALYFEDKNLKSKNIEIKQELGIIKAGEALFEKTKNSILKADLQKGVNLLLTNGASLKSEKAKLDLLSKNMLFYSDKEGSDFQYNNDKVHSLSTSINLKNKEIRLEKPKGTINEFLEASNFSADTFILNNREKKALLQNHVILCKEGLGTLESEQIELSKPDKQAISIGKTTLISPNFSISCDGRVILDDIKKTIFVKADNQLTLKDEKIMVFADRALFFYKNNFQVEKIILDGNIRFMSNYISNTTSYGTADKINYFPPIKEIYLLSNPGKKVLFWQEDNSLTLSANEIQISKDKLTNKEVIKGIGKVRFSFNFEEDKFLHEIFSKYMSKP